jgi:hypothetical protein
MVGSTKPFWLAILLVAACQAPAPPPSPQQSPQQNQPTANASPHPTASPVSPQAPDTDDDVIAIDIHVRNAWVLLDPNTLPVGNRSAVAIARAHDPPNDRGEPGQGYGKLSDRGARASELRRSFHLDGRRFLLGEPIVIEHRVELAGDGAWQEPIGGNYRARGRDDNFVFVMVARGSTEPVPDPFGDTSFSMGGISTNVKVERGSPMSYFHALQPYVAVERPGAYRLWAIQLAHGHDAVGWREAMAAALVRKVGDRYRLGATGNELVLADGSPADKSLSPTWHGEQVPSPLKASLAPEVAALLGEHRVGQVMDVAQFDIDIVAGNTATSRAMVERWRAIADKRRQMMHASRADAAFQAIWYARQDDFLPTLDGWISGDARPQNLVGLAMRPSRAALNLLLAHGGARGVSAMMHLPKANVAAAVPALIERLDHADQAMRAHAHQVLARHTGERFGATWPGYHHQRPRLDETAAIKAAASAWWKANRASFTPVP